METNARYALVGVATLLLMAGLLAFAVWLARLQFARAYDLYDVDFQGPVSGLSTGGDVYFNGIKVGNVIKLNLDRRNPNRVVARVRLASDAPVRTDSVATLEPQGVTGVNYILINAGTLTKPLLSDVTPEGTVPVIHSARGQLESLLEGGGTVLDRTVDALDRVNRLLSNQNIAAVSAALDNVRDITAQARSQRQLLLDLDATVKSVNATSDRIGVLADNANRLVDGDARKSLANLSQAADEIRATAVSVRGAVGGLSGPTADFATTGLPQLNRAVGALQESAESLNRLVGEVERNPQGVLTKAPAKTVEVKP